MVVSTGELSIPADPRVTLALRQVIYGDSAHKILGAVTNYTQAILLMGLPSEPNGLTKDFLPNQDYTVRKGAYKALCSLKQFALYLRSLTSSNDIKDNPLYVKSLLAIERIFLQLNREGIIPSEMPLTDILPLQSGNSVINFHNMTNFADMANKLREYLVDKNRM